MCLVNVAANGQGLNVAWSRFVPVFDPCNYPLVYQTFEGGFDHGETWFTSGTGSIDPAYGGGPLQGTNSLHIILASQTGWITNNFAPSDETWVYLLFRITNTPTFNCRILAMEGNNPSSCVTYIDSSWRLVASDSVSQATVGTITSNTTYHVWFHRKKGNGASSIVDVGFSTNGVRPTSGNNFAQRTDGNRTQPVFTVGIPSTQSEGNVTRNVMYDKIIVSNCQIGDQTNPP